MSIFCLCYTCYPFFSIVEEHQVMYFLLVSDFVGPGHKVRRSVILATTYRLHSLEEILTNNLIKSYTADCLDSNELIWWQAYHPYENLHRTQASKKLTRPKFEHFRFYSNLRY